LQLCERHGECAGAKRIQREGCGARIHQHKNYAEGLNV
jgi:hypothetical protein